MSKVVLVHVTPAIMGPTFYQEHVGINDSIVINLSEKDIESIISSPDKSVIKRDKILHIVDIAMPESVDNENTLSLIGIVVRDTVKESGKLLKVLNRAFTQTGDKVIRYDLRHVKIFSTVKTNQYKELDEILSEQYNHTLYCKPASNY